MIGRHLMEWLEKVTGKARRKRLEEELDRADAEIARLRTLLADATRPPTQFARMRQREVAMRRLGRLRLAGGNRATMLAGRFSPSSSDRYRTTPQ
jgi:hypothetical protein